MAEHFHGRTLPVADHLIDPGLPARERIYSGPEFTFTQGLRRIPIRSRIERQDHLNLFADVHHGQHVRIKIGAHTAYCFDPVDIGQAKADDKDAALTGALSSLAERMEGLATRLSASSPASAQADPAIG